MYFCHICCQKEILKYIFLFKNPEFQMIPTLLVEHKTMNREKKSALMTPITF